MKIIHTSDWHLGLLLYGHDRTPQQHSMVEQLCEIMSTHRPDALVVSGDIYDTTQPSSTVQKMLNDVLLQLHTASPATVIVVTAGNHDSYAKVDITSQVWSELNVRLVPRITPDDPGQSVVEIPGKGWVAAVPFFVESSTNRDYYQRIMQAATSLQGDSGLPIVLMAHTTVSGSDATGHRVVDDVVVGNITSQQLDTFGTGWDYLALGHIHRPQWIHNSNHHARYCGTPLAVSFDERCQHGVDLVEIERAGGEVQLQSIEIADPCPLVTLPSRKQAASWDDAIAELRDYPAEREALVRLNVRSTDIPAHALQLAQNETQNKQCTVLLVNPVDDDTAPHSAAQQQALSMQQLKQMAPIEIMRDYAQRIGNELSPELQQMLEQVITEVNQDQRGQ